MHLVIGGTGLVGSALAAELRRVGADFVATSRRQFDLLTSDPKLLPNAEVVYLVAAMPGFAICESNPLTWRVNVDAQIRLAKRFRESFIIYVSSDAVEIAGGTAYARQKAAVEAFIHTVDGAILRPGRITHETAPTVASLMLAIAEAKTPGVHRWP